MLTFVNQEHLLIKEMRFSLTNLIWTNVLTRPMDTRLGKDYTQLASTFPRNFPLHLTCLDQLAPESLLHLHQPDLIS